MRHIVRMLATLMLLLPVCMLAFFSDTGSGRAPIAVAASEWDLWSYHNRIFVTEPIGLTRVDEPVTFKLPSYSSAHPGQDVRITDDQNREIPYQIEQSGGSYQVTFFATVEANSRCIYHLYYGNRYVSAPYYGLLNQVLDLGMKTWKTDGVLVGWEATSSSSPTDYTQINTLRLDVNGDNNPAADPNCLTGDSTQISGRFGSLASSILGVFPLSFEKGVNVVKNGPLYCEIRIGKARLRYYKGKNWVVANRYLNDMACLSESYWSLKHGSADEVLVLDMAADSSDRTGSSGVGTNPQYLAFRNPANGLVFGAVATTATAWSINAQSTSPWSHSISFGGNADGPDAMIYWYADASNGYDGIGRFAQRMLNPLHALVSSDFAPPVTSMNLSPGQPDSPDGWYSEQPLVSLSANEASTIYYRIDGGGDLIYTEPITVPDGTHDFYYHSVDESGNQEEEKHTRFKVDSTAPELNLSLTPSTPGNFYVLNQGITFSFMATDTGAGLASILANLNGVPVQSGTTATFDRMGRYTFDVVASDTVGHQTSKSESFYVGYNFKWLSPVKRKGQPDDAPYRADAGLPIPIRFVAFDGLGKFVIDKSVKVVISDLEHEAVFTYGKARNNIKANSCTRYYTLNVDPDSYPWLKPGGTYTISVYFGGAGESPGVCHGSAILALQ